MNTLVVRPITEEIEGCLDRISKLISKTQTADVKAVQDCAEGLFTYLRRLLKESALLDEHVHLASINRDCVQFARTLRNLDSTTKQKIAQRYKALQENLTVLLNNLQNV